MITKKQLLRRIGSLEESLGLAYSPRDTKDDWDSHEVRCHGRIRTLEKLEDLHVKELRKK